MRGDRKEHGNKARIETFVVGHDIARGERLQWIVEGGKYKATFLLPDTPDGKESEGLLISEVSFRLFPVTDLNWTWIDKGLLSRPWFLGSILETMISCRPRHCTNC